MTRHKRHDTRGPDPAQRAHHRSTVEKIKSLPTPVGAVLMGIGIAGIVLPGPIGTPFFLAGGLVLAPKAFGPLDRCVQQRFPGFHRIGMDAVDRFVADMEKRYPRDRQKT